MSLYKDMERGTYVPNAASSSWKDRKREEKEIIDDLLTHFSKGRHSKTKARHTARHTARYTALHHAEYFQDIFAPFKNTITGPLEIITIH